MDFDYLLSQMSVLFVFTTRNVDLRYCYVARSDDLEIATVTAWHRFSIRLISGDREMRFHYGSCRDSSTSQFHGNVLN
jgi:hypothetical protein